MSISVDTTYYGRCRCCLSLGYHRDIMQEYHWNGNSEVYFKIFLDCFNLFLATEPKRSTLICTSCIVRLREASSFKTMIIEAEQSLLDDDVINDDEIIKDEEDYKVSEGEQSDDFEITVDVKPERSDTSDSEMNDIESYRNDDSIDLTENHDIDKSEIDSDELEKQSKNKNRTEKLAFIFNSMIILENCNAAPFKPKKQNVYPCLYCRTNFEDIPELREHQKKHTKVEILKALRTYGSHNFVLYVDVTDLKCTICNEGIPKLCDLRTHLIKKHGKVFRNYADRIIPFKITPKLLECQICKSSFETFGTLERHMNLHFRHYVCKKCGSGFASKSRLQNHLKRHAEGSFECDICKKVYGSQAKLKNHVNCVHNSLKRFKCAKCSERFTEYSRRHKHMVEVHGAAPLEYKCKLCDKIFEMKYLLSVHMKRQHLEQKDYQCDVCSYSCYNRQELKVHMIKHNGERIFECSVCMKAYARKKTLKEHMRIHNNDRRFVCEECGQAFVQKCSLKGHVKTHHPEILL